ncbi:hypothetical protein TRFO_42039 [Tritrichomonas foetus]|uniref:C2 domain-containing protein n=1 Tax=Tritrichomonas foetus TaxID=1144522 RepID=A0A1J4KY31_9EUKA|nr:hypothetical protein TRFO_42039 [Tritrichomonas foetus]|eukprot:OHT16155.1 hypothetical protein TRFO_42039 [Tritrichomonas foetus]
MQLHVKVIEARNVPAADLNGKSDPYVTLSTQRSKNKFQKTKTKKKTLTPRWDEEFTLNIEYVSDNVVIGLFDHDVIGSDDQLGLMHFHPHDLIPGVVDDRWWTMCRVSGVKKDPELHLVTQLVYKGQPKWQNLNLLLIDCYVKIIEGKDLAKMDTVGKSDPYIKLTISTDTTINWPSTKVVKNSQSPSWNESFLFWVTDPTRDKLMFKMWDKDMTSDDLMATLELPLAGFQVGVPQQKWFDFSPAKGVKKGGSIHMMICLAPSTTAWPDKPSIIDNFKDNKLKPQNMPKGGWGESLPRLPPPTLPQPGMMQPGMMPPPGMPPQMGYPPQGMPPQGGMMPPQMGYPPQGMPPQGMPPQGVPPQMGYPPQGMPPQPGMAHYQSMAQVPPQPYGQPMMQGAPYQSMAQMPPQGYPPQGYPQYPPQ